MVLPIRWFWVKTGLFLACLLVFWASFHPFWVEKYYAQLFYTHFSKGLRWTWGGLAFSVGDGFYLLFFVWGTCQMVLWGQFLYRNGWRKAFALCCHKGFVFLMVLYLAFSLFWGLNYARPDLGVRWGLHPKAYQKEDIRGLTLQLLDSTQKYRRLLGEEGVWKPLPDSLLPWTQSAFAKLGATGRTPHLGQPSLKPSMFVSLGDWLGYTGYYNPFSGEGQYRSDLPFLLQPFVALHETAHQLGFAPEDEASWVAYTAAIHHPSYRVRYSAHFELLGYALAEEYILYGQEGTFKQFEAIQKENKAKIDSGVLRDRRRVRAFFLARQNQVSPVMNSLYDQYLKMNGQTKGLRSYNAVLAWALAR